MTILLLSLISEAVETESKGGLFDFNATLPIMAFQIITLMVLLNIIFYKPIGKVLDERDESIRNKLTEASETLLRAETITKQYELELSNERKEAQLIVASAQKGAQEIVSMEIKQAQKETEQVVAEAIAELKSKKERVLPSLDDQATLLSDLIKDKLLNKQLT